MDLFSSAILEQRQQREFISNKFTFIDLFAGIGGIRLGFEKLGGICVFSSEWDKKAAKTYFANFGEYPQGDITKIDSKAIPNFDILLAGFPCQPFSIIGDKEGFKHETQGTLFFEIERILRDKQPKAFMLENVRNLTAHHQGQTFKTILSHLQSLGYFVYSKVLNALDFGLPQKRERIIICGFKDDVSFSFPLPLDSRMTLKEILDSKTCIEEMFNDINKNYDLVFGRIKRVSSDETNRILYFSKHYKNFSKSSLLWKMSIPHQALFTSKDFFKNMDFLDWIRCIVWIMSICLEHAEMI